MEGITITIKVWRMKEEGVVELIEGDPLSFEGEVEEEPFMISLSLEEGDEESVGAMDVSLVVREGEDDWNSKPVSLSLEEAAGESVRLIVRKSDDCKSLLPLEEGPGDALRERAFSREAVLEGEIISDSIPEVLLVLAAVAELLLVVEGELVGE